ncbi:hypothetical protein [Exiguobacterium sp. S22-S28]|uniref:hypothetical protein n=1 Tax=Exiguobacterium sp. S22-S28 TaxID=3342768 RepID=UPI00372D7C57
MDCCHTYKADCSRTEKEYKVFVYLITDPNEILERDENPITKALKEHKLNRSIGIYFYRFKDLEDGCGFSKIGEVSSKSGVVNRFTRGWHGTHKYGDTYLNKELFKDVQRISPENPMYFIFYEFDLLNSFPKIDEICAFYEHRKKLKCSTTNKERINSNHKLGSNLVWYKKAFHEVFDLKFPNGKPYPLLKE